MLPLLRTFVVLACLCAPLAAGSAPRLSIIDLRAVNDAASSRAVDVNDSGIVIGTNFYDTDYRPFVYSAATGMRDFATLIGAAPLDSLTLLDINNMGQIVGQWNNRPIVYSAATGVQFVGSGTGAAMEINDAGQILVQAATVDGRRTTLHTPGSAEVLIPLAPGSGGTGGGLNDAGAVVGSVDTDLPWVVRPALFSADGGLQDLGLPEGHVNGVANGINNAGTVVGVGSVLQPNGSGSGRPWRYTRDGGFFDLLQGRPAPGQHTLPTSIDENGLITGWFYDEFGGTASGSFLYHDSFGLVDADTLLTDADAATWHLHLLGRFNSSGVAAASALVDGVNRFALVQLSSPVPEPAAGWLALVAMPLLWRQKRGKPPAR